MADFDDAVDKSHDRLAKAAEEVEEALRTVVMAADYWCDYLDENDREDEVPPIEEAMQIVRKMYTK